MGQPPREGARMRYISLFSGIGGLEHPRIAPVLACESYPQCVAVLERRYPGLEVHRDIVTLTPPEAEMVVGGWPCQDLTSAGLMAGLRGDRSGLFFEMVRVAADAKAHTIVGENVPNLLSMRQGAEFQLVLEALRVAGYPFVGWRTLNSREFGLPQERRRVFVVASKHRELAHSVHAALPSAPAAGTLPTLAASGFYWTGGGRSLCLSHGYTPALKIGASDGGGRAPIAVFYGTTVRKLSANESLRLQGFEMEHFEELRASDVLRMAGNAVSRPVGEFVLDAVSSEAPSAGSKAGFAVLDEHGVYEDGMTWSIQHQDRPLAEDLGRFLDLGSRDSLSAQAAAGLLVRTIRSGYTIPLDLFDVLLALSSTRSGPMKPSRGDSFKALDEEVDVAAYRQALLRSGNRYRVGT